METNAPDLSHRDREQYFTGAEAAALINGMDPLDPGALANLWKAEGTLKELREAYSLALTEHSIRFQSLLDLDDEVLELDPRMIQSAAMGVSGDHYVNSMNLGLLENFENQKFSRTELARWVQAAGLDSRYCFEPAQAVQVRPPSGYQRCDTQITRSKQRDQESRILDLLVAAGYNPLQLPDRPKGGQGVKAEIESQALAEKSLFSSKSFAKAWDRLRSDDRIRGAL